jgi:hypothetical protein
MKVVNTSSQKSKSGSNGSRKKGRKKTGIIIMLTGILIIFISSLLNTIQNECFDAASQLSRNIFIFDILSTFGVLLIPWGLFLILHREAIKEEAHIPEGYLCSSTNNNACVPAEWN